MLARLLRLLAPLTPRRRSRLFPIFRRGRFETGLFRSRRPPPLATSAHPASLAPSSRPLAAPASSPTRQKSGPSYLSPARIPSGDSGWREIAPPSPPPNPRRPPQALSPHPIPATAGCPARPHGPASRPPLPHRPGKTSPSRAASRSARRRPRPGASPLQPKNAPPNLKSFLEKTLTRASPPRFAPQDGAPTIRGCPRPTGPTRGIPSARPSPSSLRCWPPLAQPSGPPPSSGPGRTSAAAPRTSTSASSPPSWSSSSAPLGALLYMLLRPAETLDEAHLRQLQEDTLLQDMEGASDGPQLHAANGVASHHRPQRLSGTRRAIDRAMCGSPMTPASGTTPSSAPTWPPCHIGRGTNVQDGCVLHVDAGLPLSHWR